MTSDFPYMDSAVMTAGRRTGKDQVSLSNYPSNNNGGLHKDLP